MIVTIIVTIVIMFIPIHWLVFWLFTKLHKEKTEELEKLLLKIDRLNNKYSQLEKILDRLSKATPTQIEKLLRILGL